MKSTVGEEMDRGRGGDGGHKAFQTNRVTGT